jgi:uncharacterized protein (DUF2141 family)
MTQVFKTLSGPSAAAIMLLAIVGLSAPLAVGTAAPTASAAPNSATGANVTIALKSVAASPHKVYISLQKQDEFLQPKGSYGDMIVLAYGGTKDVVIPNVAPGDYAVSVWHDTNGDGKFTMDAFGMPADGWGMYQGEKLRGMPTWDAVKFTVTGKGAVVPVTILYPKQKS